MLPYITRNQKKLPKSTKEMQDDNLQKIYDEITKIQTGQLMLENCVAKLECKNRAIDISEQSMMTNFYRKYLLYFDLIESYRVQ